MGKYSYTPQKTLLNRRKTFILEKFKNIKRTINLAPKRRTHCLSTISYYFQKFHCTGASSTKETTV